MSSFLIQLPSQRVLGYIDHGKQEGATVHVGGHQVGTEGYFVHPTIFTDVKPEMKIAREEIFGPVAAIIKFKDEAGEIVPTDSDNHPRVN